MFNHLLIKLFYFVTLISLVQFFGCDDQPPSFPQPSGQTRAGEELTAGLMTGGEIPLAGELMAGETTAGELMAGETTAGEFMAGETTAGELMAGETTAGEPMAGETTAGEPVAGETTAGEPMAGESMAGESMAGETTAGEAMAGEPMAGEPMNMISQSGDQILFEGSFEQNGSNSHRFITDQVLSVHIKVMGRNGAACPDNADSVLTLNLIQNEQAEMITSNDDYTIDHLCSEIKTIIEPGDYEVVVEGFEGQALPDYVLEINFYPVLEEGSFCDNDSFNSGLCPLGFACISNQCRFIAPQINALVATKAMDSIYLSVEGEDADTDAAFINLSILDRFGNTLAVNEQGEMTFFDLIPIESAPFNTGLTTFSFDFITSLVNLDLAVEVRLEIEDLLGNVSEALTVNLEAHPILLENEACQTNGIGGLCDQGLSCRTSELNAELSCQVALAPTLSSAMAYSRDDAFIFQATGIDLDQDIIGLGLTLYDQAGETVFGMGGIGRELVETLELRPIPNSDEMTYIVTLTKEGSVANSVAAEISLIDRIGNESERLIASIIPLPVRQVDQDCDVLRFSNLCSEGLCYPKPNEQVIDAAASGSCRLELPVRGEYCDYGLGCANGFTCYGPENNGNLTDRFQTCMRICDANVDPQGCSIDEFCLPDFDWASLGNTEISSPGVCLISDQCLPGSEDSTCPSNQASCLRIDQITLCIDLDDTPIAIQAGLGETCTGINTPCQPGLVCEVGQCRQACDESNTCQANEVCRTFDEVYYDGQSRYSACFDLCNPVSQDCDNGQSCMVYQSNSSSERLTLCSEESAGSLSDGETCTRNPDDNYWGNCGAEYFCTRLLRDDLNECMPICTQDDKSACTGNRACAFDLINSPDVGLCAGNCDFFSGNDCGFQQSCFVGWQGQNAQGETLISGLCVNDPGRGNGTLGSPCTIDENNISNDCQANHICLQGSCYPHCQAGVAGHCPETMSCINIVPNTTDFIFGETLSELGICLPN